MKHLDMPGYACFGYPKVLDILVIMDSCVKKPEIAKDHWKSGSWDDGLAHVGGLDGGSLCVLRDWSLGGRDRVPFNRNFFAGLAIFFWTWITIECSKERMNAATTKVSGLYPWSGDLGDRGM